MEILKRQKQNRLYLDEWKRLERKKQEELELAAETAAETVRKASSADPGIV